jgi:hypothetical protein
MMICVLVGVATVPVVPPPLIVTPGVPMLAKKPDGYVNVMLLFVGISEHGLKDIVAEMFNLPATRSECIIEKDT